MRRHIGIVVALALLMTAPPQFVLSEDMVPVEILTADSQDDAGDAEVQAAAEAEAQAAAQAAAEAEAQAAAQAAAEAEAQAAAQAAAEAEAQAAAQAAAEAEAQAAAEAQAQAAAQAAAQAEAQAAPEAESAAVETLADSAPAPTQSAESVELSDETDGADDSQSVEEQEALSEETESTQPAEEVMLASEDITEAATEAEETEEDLEAAEGEDTYAYAFESAEVETPSLGGPYTLGSSLGGLAAPSTSYRITVTHTLPDSTIENTTVVQTVSGSGTWQRGTSSSGPWEILDLSTVPSDKSEVYVRYCVPETELSFMGMDGTEQVLSVPKAESEAVLLSRKYPQLFSPTIAQNGSVADYAFTMEGYPGTSITLCLVDASGATLGGGTVTMTDLPSSKKVVNHFLNADWDINIFGLQESDINQHVRLKVVQNAVDGDAISPCDPFYSNELYLVTPIRGKVALPAAISVGDEVAVDLSQMKNVSNLGLNYQWYLGGGDSAKAVSGGNGSTYIVSIEDMIAYGSKVLSCSVTDVLGKTLHTQEVTVQPLDLSGSKVDIDWDEEAVYTGSKSFPTGIIVSVGGYEVPEDMWKVSKVNGKNCVNIGEAWMKIKGLGEYVTGVATVKYKIGNGTKPQPKPTPAPKAAPAPAPADLTVTDSLGKAKRYEIRIVDETSEDQSENADQADAARIYEVNTFDDSTVDGEIVYSQRNLHITRDMINKAKEAGCSVIRLRVKDGGIDLAISELTKDSYTVRLAPEDGKDVTSEESNILSQYNPQGEMYRVSVRTKNADGEEIDVIDTMLEAKALLFGDREANTECLQIAYDNLEPAVNNVKIKSAGSTNYLSASIFKRSLFSGTLVG